MRTRPALRRTAAGVLAATLAATMAACGSDEKPAAGPTAVNTEIAPPTATAAETFSGQGLSSFTLEKLSAALTKDLASGNEKSFLANIAPGHPRLLAQQRTWFRNVRAVPMSTRKLVLVRPTRSIDSSGKGVLTALVGFEHQIKGSDSRPVSEWYSFGFKRSGDRLGIVSVGGAPADTSSGEKYSRYYRQAWDDGPIAALGDDKVVLLGEQRDRGTMQGLLPRLGAAVRDQLAEFRRTGAKVEPSVYSRRWVFTFPSSGVRDFFDYYGGLVDPREADYAAFTTSVYSSLSFGDLDYGKGVMTSRIVLNRSMAGYSSESFATTIRHEMVHAVQASWDGDSTPRTPTWVTEGLAVAFSNPASGERSFRSAAGRRGLAGASSLPVRNFYQGNNETVAQHYGMGYLAMSYLLDKRGAKAVLDLVHRFEASGDEDFFKALGVDQPTFLGRVKKWAGA